MPRPPQFPALRETELGIGDGPIDGPMLRDIFKRLLAQTNPGLDATNKSLSKGLTPTEHFRCETVTVKATHAVPLTIRLKTLRAAASCIPVGCDTSIVAGAGVQMLQSSQSGGVPTAQITVWFQSGSGTANVRLWLFEDGLQMTTAPAFSSGGAPSGSAGGDLTGTYPNPTLAVDRIPKNLLTTAGDLIYASGVSTPARLGIGADGTVLTASGGVPTWGAAGAFPTTAEMAYKTITGAISGAFNYAADAYVSFTGTALYNTTYASSGMTVDATNGKITVTNAGTYEIEILGFVQQTTTSVTASQSCLSVQKNGTTDIEFTPAFGINIANGQSARGPVSKKFVAVLAASDFLIVRASGLSPGTGSTDTAAIKFYQLSLAVTRLA